MPTVKESSFAGLTQNWVKLLKAFGITEYKDAVGRSGSEFAIAYNTALSHLRSQFPGEKFPSLDERNLVFDHSVNENDFNLYSAHSNEELASMQTTGDVAGAIQILIPQSDSVIKLLCAGEVNRFKFPKAKDENNANNFFDKLGEACRPVVAGEVTGYVKINPDDPQEDVYDMSLILDQWASSDVIDALKRLPLNPLSSGGSVTVPTLTAALKSPHVSVTYKLGAGINYADGSMRLVDDKTVLEQAPNEFRVEPRYNRYIDYRETVPEAQKVSFGMIDFMHTLALWYNTGMVGMIAKPADQTGDGIMVILGGISISEFATEKSDLRGFIKQFVK